MLIFVERKKVVVSFVPNRKVQKRSFQTPTIRRIIDDPGPSILFNFGHYDFLNREFHSTIKVSMGIQKKGLIPSCSSPFATLPFSYIQFSELGK